LLNRSEVAAVPCALRNSGERDTHGEGKIRSH
jgi:hypothetical protein